MVINQIARVRCPGFYAPAVLPTIPYEIPGLTRDWTSQRKNALEPGQYKTWTADCRLGIKYGPGIKRGLENTDWV